MTDIQEPIDEETEAFIEALCDTSRLRILDTLRGAEELSEIQIVKVLNAHRSDHVRIPLSSQFHRLIEAGLIVEVEKEQAQFQHYALASQLERDLLYSLFDIIGYYRAQKQKQVVKAVESESA